MHLHHNCENKRCVNDQHLALLTRKQHRQWHARCLLSPVEQQQAIDWVITTEKSQLEVARYFQVAPSTIGRIIRPYVDALIDRCLSIYRPKLWYFTLPTQLTIERLAAPGHLDCGSLLLEIR
jgi:hypothetical protein